MNKTNIKGIEKKVWLVLDGLLGRFNRADKQIQKEFLTPDF